MSKTKTVEQFPFLAEGGELGSLIRSFDWERTPLGSPGKWPQSLKTAIRILLTSRQPMFIWWGEELINLYNDPYRSILGGKHPQALGRPASEVWREIWDQVGPRVHSAISRDEGTYDEALFLMMERNGYPEETYYTFSYSPLPNDEGRTSGIFCANTDDTQRIIGARRLALQRELAARTLQVKTICDACASCAAALATNPRDLPFALLYLKQQGENRAVLMGRAGIMPDHSAALPSISLDDSGIWQLADVFRRARPEVIALSEGIAFPTGAWNRPPEKAVLLPINASGRIGHSAVLIAALNPHRPYDRGYEEFLALVGTQIASALTGAQAYEEERERAEALAELDRAKTTFFSNVSHEFRTPLTLMLGPVEDLLGRDASGPQREVLQLVYRNGLRMQKLVNALLDFSRIEAGRVLARVEPVDLASFTAELASVFRSAMERAGLRFKVDCLPLSQPVCVDREMWEKIVLNLLSNALKYTFEGTIAVRLKEEAGQAKLTVSDTGTGIPEAELPRLFERFHRVEGAQARTQEGTGIGLALVQELVRLHAGSVDVESAPGKGSTFTVSIPFGTPVDGQSISEPRLSSGESPSNAYVEEALGWLRETREAAGVASLDGPVPANRSAPQGRVVLADDNGDMRDYVQRLLQAEYEVIAVRNGREAFEAAVAAAPDLILSDVMMPECDGFELLARLRAHPGTRSIPVVFLSARAGEEASAEAREAGADDYIVKPFTARELLARVRGTVLIRRERRHAAEQLNRIFAQAPVAICVLRKPDFVYELANPFYRQLVRGRELVGRKIADVIPNIPQDVWDAFHQVVDTGQSFVANEWYVPYDADGDGEAEPHWFNALYYPLRDARQNIDGLVAVVFEITQQVQARKEVERVNRELEEFAYVASHDLQEPLRMVNLFSQLLVKRLETASPEEIRKYADFIGSAANRMQQLIQDLLSFARAVHGETPALLPVSLRACLDRALDFLQLDIREADARVQVGNLPVVLGGETQLTQLFQNLVSNALKYAKPEVSPTIRIEARRSGKEWVVSLRDNGIGFKQEYAGHIFGLFKRLYRSEYPGTGLGLAICKRIVERYGGRIWAESEPGEGSTFSFALVAANEDDQCAAGGG